jgi:superfamily II DNA helicase RecQ
VVSDIIAQLKLVAPRCFRLSFNRTNIYYEVVQAVVANEDSGSGMKHVGCDDRASERRLVSVQ